IAAMLTIIGATTSQADPIEGHWRLPNGVRARVTQCATAYCVTLESGRFSGTRIGRLHRTKSGYAGRIVNPRTNKSYNGRGRIQGNRLTVQGCVLGGIICRGQTWYRR
ncbi:MAG: DUF2147 domain-containing protein, partial [Pararhizobium sp.]